MRRHPAAPGRCRLAHRDWRRRCRVAVESCQPVGVAPAVGSCWLDSRVRHGSGSGRSEEHTSELQSLMRISYAVFCLKKKKNKPEKNKKTTEHEPTQTLSKKQHNKTPVHENNRRRR